MTAPEAAEILGLNLETATPADVKKAFRRLTLLYHPDRHQDKSPQAQKQASNKLRQVLEARAFMDLYFQGKGFSANRKNTTNRHNTTNNRGAESSPKTKTNQNQDTKKHNNDYASWRGIPNDIINKTLKRLIQDAWLYQVSSATEYIYNNANCIQIRLTSQHGGKQSDIIITRCINNNGLVGQETFSYTINNVRNHDNETMNKLFDVYKSQIDVVKHIIYTNQSIPLYKNWSKLSLAQIEVLLKYLIDNCQNHPVLEAWTNGWDAVFEIAPGIHIWQNHGGFDYQIGFRKINDSLVPLAEKLYRLYRPVVQECINKNAKNNPLWNKNFYTY